MKRKTTAPEAPAVDERLLNRYRYESNLLHPQANMGMSFPINRNDINDLKSELLRLVGGSDGKFYLPDRRTADGSRYHLSKIPDLKNRIKEIEDRFKKYQQSEIDYGNNKPAEMPSNYKEDHAILRARLQVALEEKEFLESRIKPLENVVAEKESKILPRKQWNTLETDSEGLICKIGGMHVTRQDPEDPTSILMINDTRSDFHLIPLPRFKVEVTGAIARERSFRERTERKEAEAQNRRRKLVEEPETPIWNAETESLSYNNYSNEVLRYLKNLK